MRCKHKILLLTLLFMATVSSLQAQPRLLTTDQLNSRLAAGGDTTFIVNLWATWCGPCLKELPHFERLGQELQGQKVKILLLSADTRSKINSTVTPMAKRLKLKNEVFVINEEPKKGYFDRIDKNWTGALPATIFINKTNGKREFFEKEFTYAELVQKYKAISR